MVIVEEEKSTRDILGELSDRLLVDFKIGGLLLWCSLFLFVSPLTSFEEDKSVFEPLSEPLPELPALDLLLSLSSRLLLRDLVLRGLASTILSFMTAGSPGGWPLSWPLMWPLSTAHRMSSRSPQLWARCGCWPKARCELCRSLLTIFLTFLEALYHLTMWDTTCNN